MNKSSLNSIAIFLLMALLFLVSNSLKPHLKLSEKELKIDLNTMVSDSVNGWKYIKYDASSVINPEQTLLVDKLYGQTLSRFYQKDDKLVMVSVAYGDNQSDATALHYPEVCYPAQGFKILKNSPYNILIDNKVLPVKRLIATTTRRKEFITYWTTMGNYVVRGKAKTKITQIKYALQGYIPDGMIFRVSSIGSNEEQEFENHKEFISHLILDMQPPVRKRFAGF